MTDTPVQEIRSLNYLLSELSRWEEEGIVGHEQASGLRESYERRREELRAQLAASRKKGMPDNALQGVSLPAAAHQRSQLAPATDFPPPAPEKLKLRRTLLETLADPQTIRILLYTGAAMLVVGVVIWLRDILYLKLREPTVQAALLMLGTVIFTVWGWLTILRTRLRLTGRALTLTGSLLVPVNFWFLVRSGLIENNGRAWLVCAFCAVLYALTAEFLRERLYVYLASVAAIASAWALIYRNEREAFGLYALALMAASLSFIHLSRLFTVERDDGRLTDGDGQMANGSRSSFVSGSSSSQELWRLPLMQVALAGVALDLLFYMLLRTGSPSSFADGLLRLRANEYDPSIAMLLSAAAAYLTWFTGRYILTDRRTLLITASVLALVWTEFLWLDGLRIPGESQLLVLAATALILALMARVWESDAWELAFHRVSLTLIVALAILTYPVISVAHTTTTATTTSPLTHSLILLLLTSTYAISGRALRSSRRANETPAHVSLAFATVALVVLLAIINLRVGDPSLLMPSAVLGLTGLLLFVASLRLDQHARARCFRAGLFALMIAFTLSALRAGFDPFGEMEIYTSPVGVMLLIVAYLYTRREVDEYASDAKLLLWAGSFLLAAPLLLHALQYRLFLDVPAPWRDLATLCAALALLICGIVGRLRAPVLVGAISLAIELSALALTSVSWLQIPLKVYLISTGALILLFWGLLEFRREQLLLMRKRISERREMAREQFGEWK
jgi:hypothetical protein